MGANEPQTMLRELKFENLLITSPKNTHLKELLKDFEGSTNENDQKDCIKGMLEIYQNSSEQKTKYETTSVVLELFTRFTGKRILKKYLQTVVGKLQLTTPFIITTTEELLHTIKKEQICYVKQSIHLMNFVTIMQNSGLFDHEKTIEYLCPLYLIIFEGFVYNLKYNVTATSMIPDEVQNLVNLILKQILSVFVKNIPFLQVVSKEHSVNLIVLSHAIISSEYIGFDLKTKAGLILTHSFMIIPSIHKNHFKYKDCPPLDLLDAFNDNKYVVLGNNQLTVLSASDAAVVLFSSILNVLPNKTLVEVKVDGHILLFLLYEKILEYGDRVTSIANSIVEISRTLSLVGNLLGNVPSELLPELFCSGISFVCSHIDHSIDTVRNYTRLFFRELARVASFQFTIGHDELAGLLLATIKHLGEAHPLRFLAWENIAIEFGWEFLMENFPDLPDYLINFLTEPTIANHVCSTYITIMEKHFPDVDTPDWISTWISPLNEVLRSCPESSHIWKQILPAAFQLCPSVLRTIFPSDFLGTVQECAVVLKCLQYARSNGTEISTTAPHVYWRGLIEKDKMNQFMVHQDDEIRILALGAIVESLKSTEIYLDWELNYLTTYLHYNVASQSPNIRKQVITYYKKALARFSAGRHVILRNITTLSRDLETATDRRETVAILRVFRELKNSYKLFLRKITRQLVSYLTFDSSYYRRCTSLELLITVQSLMTKDEWLSCWSEEDVKNCHGILFDGYESNKKMAVILLETLPASYIGFSNIEFTFKYMQRCLSIALAIQPTKVVAAAYLLKVCSFSPYFYEIFKSGAHQGEFEIDGGHDTNLDMLVVLTGKLIAQSSLNPDPDPKVANYGILLSIRYILQNRDISINNDAYSEIFTHLANLSLNLRKDILPIVCNPSPEGMSTDYSDLLCESDYCPKSHLIVVCAWRTIKEMTLLLAELVHQTVKLEKSLTMLKDGLMIQISEFFINIFIESKHRGVFEQAFIGFCTVCESFWMSNNSRINSLPDKWLKDAIALCTGEKQSDKLSTTRRSAGLPFMIVAILCSEPGFNKPRFSETITALLSACKEPNSQNDDNTMHCMNVLRAIFRNSKLGETVSRYIGEGVMIAINGFDSEVWGIRNSATLLYSALMTRMFGVQRTQDSEEPCMKNRMTVRVFALRFPELFQFLLDKLSEHCQKSDSLVLHPVLMILTRLYPSQKEEYNDQLGKYLPYLKTCFSNPELKTRDLAAKAAMAFTQTDDILSQLNTTFARVKKVDVKDNECHGLLLYALHLLKSATLPKLSVTTYLQNSIHILHYAGRKFSDMTAVVYVEVITHLLIKFPDYDNVQILKTIVTMLSRQIASGIIPITSPSRYPQSRFLLLLLIVINKFEENDSSYPTLTNQIMCQLYGHNREMKCFCFHLLIYMNQVLNEPNTRHALYLMGEMQIPSDIVLVVDNIDKSSVTKLLKNIHQYLKCFLIEEIKYCHYTKKEDLVLLFLLVNYYPCVVKYLYLSKQSTLNTLLKYCDSDNEELISAVISCISTFLLQLDYNVLSYTDLMEHLAQSASPAVSAYRRLAVCDFLVKNYILYCNEEPILIGDALPMVLSIVMVLLEDDDVQVRNAMSDFATTLKIRIILNNRSRNTLSGRKIPVIPEKAREDLINLATIVLHKQSAICFLFSWACRHFPDPASDSSDQMVLFDQSELNLYAENVPFVDLCSRLLYNLLWTLEDDLNYEDRSIFLEEHTLLVTTVLLDSLEKNPSPMMVYRTKLSVICALKSTVKFVERFPINNNFVPEFKTYMNEKILGYLTRHVEHPDIFSVKKILKNVYAPILDYRY